MAAAAGAARLVRMDPELTVESAELPAAAEAEARTAAMFPLQVRARLMQDGEGLTALMQDRARQASIRQAFIRIMAALARQAAAAAEGPLLLPALMLMEVGAASMMFTAMAFMVLAAAEAAAARRVAGFSMLAEAATVMAAARAAAMAQRRHRGRAALSSSPIFLSHLLFSFLLLNLQMGHISLF
jgi:hypothetical protein